MKRRLLSLTAREVRNVRCALRTAQEEDCGRKTFREYDALLAKLESAPEMTRAEWQAVDRAADNSMGGDMQDQMAVQSQRDLATRRRGQADQNPQATRRATRQGVDRTRRPTRPGLTAPPTENPNPLTGDPS